MAGPTLERGIDYDQLPPSTPMKDLQPGDRFIYSGRTFEITGPTRLSPSGKKYHSQWRMVDYSGSSHYMRQYYATSAKTDFEISGLTKTTTRRVVYRPADGHYFQHYIEEWA